jgi:hypothetical protein
MCGGKNVDGPKEIQKEPEELKQIKSVTVAPLPKRLPTRKFLDAILASKELCVALESFLQAEFCLENLLFIQKTGEYRQLYQTLNLENEEDRRKLGEIRDFVLKEFMLPSSEKEVFLVD